MLLASKYTLIRKLSIPLMLKLLIIFYSIADGECSKKNVEYQYQQVTGKRTTVAFTYSVQWKEVKDKVNRWDAFLLTPNKEIHYYTLLNGLIVALLVFGIIVVIILKTIHKDTGQEDKDFKVYDDADDFIGWKLISRDVFRRPVYGGLLTPVIGSGIQLLIVFIGLIGKFHYTDGLLQELMYSSLSLHGMVSPCSAWFFDTLVYIIFLVGRVKKKERKTRKSNTVLTHLLQCTRWLRKC